MSNFLLEILLEEVPHGVLPYLIQNTEEQVPQLLGKNGLTYDSISYYISPRRIGFLIKGLPIKGQDQLIEQKGPSVKVAFDENGKATRALEGFLSSNQAQIEELEEREIKGQRYFFLLKKEEGQEISKILPKVLQEFVNSFKFSQPMRWNYKGEMYEFIRPVRGLTAVLNSQIISFEFCGLKSNNILRGHRQISQEDLILTNASDYEVLLEQNFVIPSFKKRKNLIQQEINKITQEKKAVALLDDELLSILASLTEFPQPILAAFDEKFLALPKEVLISEMKIHQKYVPILDSEEKLLPYYIIVSNMPINNDEVVRNILKGNNRVLTARFADGKFFFEEDLKKGLEYYSNSLKSVAFIEGAGSVANKIERMQNIAEYLRLNLCPNVSSDELKQAVQYCKADLSSLMVGEFPELQGIIGSYYASKKGLSQSVALAIKEHYYPMNIDGEHFIPTQELSALVGLADRLDNLLTLYAVGKTVTGSRDPYALRRQTVTLIEILVQFDWKFSLEHFFENQSHIYQGILQSLQIEWKKTLLDFIKVRLESLLKGEPYIFATDTLNASLGTVDIITNDIKKVATLHKVRTQQPQEFSILVELFKRIVNIIKDQEIGSFNELLLEDEAEKNLYIKYQEIYKKISQSSYQEQLELLLSLKNEISVFFDKIMVKSGDTREVNRLSMLNQIIEMFVSLADFSKLS